MFLWCKNFLYHFLHMHYFWAVLFIAIGTHSINCVHYILLLVSLMCYYTTASKFANVVDFVGQFFGAINVLYPWGSMPLSGQLLFCTLYCYPYVIPPVFSVLCLQWLKGKNLKKNWMAQVLEKHIILNVMLLKKKISRSVCFLESLQSGVIFLKP